MREPRDTRCARCRYHYARSSMMTSEYGRLICRDRERCDRNLATRAKDKAVRS